MNELLSSYGKCQNIIYEEEDGSVERCGNECNPAEQLCHHCRMFVH